MVAAEVLHFELADEVWLVPCGVRPDKSLHASPQERLELCQIAVQATFPLKFPVKVIDTEINAGYLPTVYLLRNYRKLFPKNEFSMVIGTDLVASLPEWDLGTELIKETRFIIVPRCDPHGLLFAENHIPNLHADRLAISPRGLHAAITNLSSTEVRRRVRLEGVNGAVGLVPLAVLNEIQRLNLYTDEHELGDK